MVLLAPPLSSGVQLDEPPEADSAAGDANQSSKGGRPSGDAMKDMRKRFENMSDEEKAELRKKMGSRGTGGGRPSKDGSDNRTGSQ